MKTLFTGKCFTELEKVDSTNRYALDLVHNGLARHGQVIVAGEQTNGRGQRERKWDSEPGKNLLASFLYQFNHIPIASVFGWNMAVALAVAQTIGGLPEMENQEIAIKWPNDILANGKKISGILVENVIARQSLRWSVAGIGVNVNQKFNRNSEQVFPAVSLSQLLERDMTCYEVLENLACEMEHAFFLFTGGQEQALLNNYNRLLYGKNEWIPLSANNRRFMGKIEKVTLDGQVHVVTESGELHTFTHGELGFLGKT